MARIWYSKAAGGFSVLPPRPFPLGARLSQSRAFLLARIACASLAYAMYFDNTWVTARRKPARGLLLKQSPSGSGFAALGYHAIIHAEPGCGNASRSTAWDRRVALPCVLAAFLIIKNPGCHTMGNRAIIHAEPGCGAASWFLLQGPAGIGSPPGDFFVLTNFRLHTPLSTLHTIKKSGSFFVFGFGTMITGIIHHTDR